MSGIEKITDRILAEARQEAEACLSKARQEAETALAAARAEAQALREQLLREGEAAAERDYSLRLSAVETAHKKALLLKKQALLDEVFALATEQLRSLPDKAYLSLLAALAVKASETGQEQILLNAADRERMGDKVVEEANRSGNLQLSLSPETRPIVGGLILSQGKVEWNCALDRLVAQQRQTLAAQTAARLFA